LSPARAKTLNHCKHPSTDQQKNGRANGVELHWFARALSRAAFSRPPLRLLKQYGRTRPKLDRNAPGMAFDPPKIEEGHFLLATPSVV
jgi:hypothetical protein